MFQEGGDMYHLYGLMNLVVSVGLAALFIYILFKLRKRKKKSQDKNQSGK